jgi:F0F1-type ATP synthase membrane subunit c/vacuolar-type H+-ATPase subunit K
MITDEEVKKGLMTLNIIWFAILMSLVIYLVVGLQVKENMQTSMDAATFTTFKSILYGIAAITLVIARFVRKFVLSEKGGKFFVKSRSRQTTQNPVLAKYTAAMIISLALTESVGIYGLVLFFIGKNALDLYLLIAVSAIAMLFYRPNKEEIIALSQGADGRTE